MVFQAAINNEISGPIFFGFVKCDNEEETAIKLTQSCEGEIVQEVNALIEGKE